MTSFDANGFLSNVQGGGGLIDSAIGAFGLPTCILQLKRYALFLLPSDFLVYLNRAVDQARGEIDKKIKEGFNWLATELGFQEYITADGIAQLRSKYSMADFDFSFGAKILAFVNAAADIYQAVQDAKAFIDEMRECLLAVKAFFDKTDNKSAAAYTGVQNEGAIAAAIAGLEQLQIIRQQVVDFQTSILEELNARNNDPNREPAINSKYSDVFGSGYRYASEQEEQPLIRLVYGPPVTDDGRFVLSTDGLYYDSQSEDGLRPLLLQIIDRKQALDKANNWLFEHDPNLGGRGEHISDRTFSKWIGSVFDINKIDSSDSLSTHYSSDTFLRILEGQRDKRMLDMKEQIDDLINQKASEAIINNVKQSLVSEVAQLESKVNRRKKQIEIAVKAPTIFGSAVRFNPGQVPINDFSYLQDYNISLAFADQKSLVIDAASVSGIVLPIEPKFTKSTLKAPDKLVLNELLIPDTGLDSLMIDGDEVDTSGVKVNMDEVVSTDGLFGLYNFLNSNTVLPSSVDANLNNCITLDTEGNAFLVSKSASDFFVDLGLAAPYFKGITENGQAGPSALGSFVKLPDTTDFQDWTYSRGRGFSFESWVYMPTLEDASIGWKDNGVSSLYRLILANENTGIRRDVVREEDYNLVPYSNGLDYTKGLIFGFTIDRRWTRTLTPSNDFSDQDPNVNGYGLLLAPTISYDSSSATFFSNPACETSEGWLGMYVPHDKQTASGKTLANCRDDYMLLSFSVNYMKDLVTVFLDGEVLETSAASTVFGTRPTESINIPNFKQLNSFEYGQNTVGSLAPKSLRNGPKLGNFFTPWILGGGYTDGNINGGFMGGEYGGLISGLRGFLGSVKFYKKAIGANEVNKNYSSQKDLFKRLKWARTVIIATGQSNMDAGYAYLSAVDTSYRGPQEGIEIWNPVATYDAGAGFTGAWQVLNPNTRNIKSRYYDNVGGALNGSSTGDLPPGRHSTSPSSISPSVEFCRKLRDLKKKNSSIKSPIYLIQSTHPGTSMTNFDPGASALSWSTSYSRLGEAYTIGYHKYDTMIYDITNALSEIPKPIDLTVIIHQGENEVAVPFTYQNTSLSSFIADNWHTGFNQFYTYLKEDITNILGLSESYTFPWIVGRIHAELIGDSFGTEVATPQQPYLISYHFVDNVRASQTKAVEELGLNAHLVNADGLSFVLNVGLNQAYDGSLPDEDLRFLHFDGPAAVTLGGRFFEKYKQIKGYE